MISLYPKCFYKIIRRKCGCARVHDITILIFTVIYYFCVEKNIHIAAVDEAVEELAQVDPRQAQIVELRFFAGLTIEEIAQTLALSPATVKRDWATAKLWLRARLVE